MSENQSKFDLWWNSYKVKRVVGVIYSVGASVVILGAMGKILHTSWGGYVLGVGMGVEAFLFFLGSFDKPYKEYDWSKIFDFENSKTHLSTTGFSGAGNSVLAGHSVDALAGLDVKKFSDGINKLSETTEHLNSLGKVVSSAEKLVHNLDTASEAASKFTSSQQKLVGSVESLNNSYAGIVSTVNGADKSTRSYTSQIEEINKHLSSVNSIYEIHIRNLQQQTEGLNKQTSAVNAVTEEVNKVLLDVQKVRSSSAAVVEQTDNYKAGTEKLAKQIAELNAVYGNMLNALS